MARYQYIASHKVPKDLEVHDWGELTKWEDMISFYEKLALGLDYGQAKYALDRPVEPQDGDRVVNYITQQVRKAICKKFRPKVEKMRTLHEILCHLEEGYTAWNEPEWLQG